ncbi:pyrroloquinoline quinone biosynthesis protein PqqB [Streptomyces melanosporofaciens]|uniref:Coenzyme PQQ synthesis protein B n=1 Tax=Streptomyces melanosporofaciens TaxID=67327 RepID=A0A1H4XQ87_STRMJ|nr:pyrroloquinoline quinone biosynthesis protein B [Streptomyces melanosporofaciens]
MRVRVLGTAAGGGVPQWNCACPGCSGARAHPGWRRRHASLAVQAAEGRWYLVNATPDLGEQVEECPELHPGPEPRRTPLAGVILTDAELDHTLGIARLREADGIEIVATAPVRNALLTGLHLGEVLTPYARLDWRPLDPGDRPLAEDSPLAIGAVPVSAKRPRYAAGLDAADDDAPDDDAWVVALRLTDRTTGRSLLYAPALATWPDAFQRAAESADHVIVDGTFWSDDEPSPAASARAPPPPWGICRSTDPAARRGGSPHSKRAPCTPTSTTPTPSTTRPRPSTRCCGNWASRWPQTGW